MSNPWFRLYSEFATDPKIQMLSEADQRRFIMILCLRCCNGDVTLHETEIAFFMRISEPELSETKARFVAKGFIDNDWKPLNWDKRQFASDSSATRVRKHRELSKSSCNGDVTLHETNGNVLEQNRTEQSKPISIEIGSPSPSADGLEVGKGKLPNCPHQKILELYETNLPILPQPVAWEGQRQQNLAARWRWVLTAKKRDGARYATDTESALSFFCRFFAYVAQSDFLTGRDGKWQGCDIGWLLKAENFAKVLSGNYENREAA